MQPAGSQQLRQEGIINATHRGPPFACPRQKDHTCHWRKAAVRLDVIIAGNVQDVKRPACCFQQALQSDPYLLCFISWEPVKLNTPTEKWSFFCLFFFPQSYSFQIQKGDLIVAFSMATLVVRLVLLFWYLTMKYFVSVCAGDFGSSPGFRNLVSSWELQNFGSSVVTGYF